MNGTGDVVIRDAGAADFDAVAALTNRYIVGTAVHFGYEPVTADEMRSAWESSRSAYPYLVAECGGAFAGFAKAGVWRERAAYAKTAEVGIYLEPAVQRRGVGTRLYGALLERLRAAGYHVAVGGLTLPNAASERLHERLGFERVGVFRQVGWKLGAWHDVAWYQRVL